MSHHAQAPGREKSEHHDSEGSVRQAAQVARRALPWIIGTLTLLFVAGCETVGLIEYKNPATGESWRAQNPPQAAQPVTLTRSSLGDVSASASAPRREDTVVKLLWIVPLIGTGLIVLGVATLTLRGWFASVPISASLASMACGAVLIAAPKIVQEAWWIIAVMIGAPGIVIVMYGISWFDNRVKLKTPITQPVT